MNQSQMKVLNDALSHWKACMVWGLGSLHATEQERQDCRDAIEAIETMSFELAGGKTEPIRGLRGVLGEPQRVGYVDERDKTRQPQRAIMGHCPECKRLVIVENNHETWPLVYCGCGWVGPTTAVINRMRAEDGGVTGEQ